MSKKIKGVQYSNPISKMSRIEGRQSPRRNSTLHQNEKQKLNTNIKIFRDLQFNSNNLQKITKECSTVQNQFDKKQKYFEFQRFKIQNQSVISDKRYSPLNPRLVQKSSSINENQNSFIN
jgi:hypothetical protein